MMIWEMTDKKINKKSLKNSLVQSQKNKKGMTK